MSLPFSFRRSQRLPSLSSLRRAFLGAAGEEVDLDTCSRVG